MDPPPFLNHQRRLPHPDFPNRSPEFFHHDNHHLPPPLRPPPNSHSFLPPPPPHHLPPPSFRPQLPQPFSFPYRHPPPPPPVDHNSQIPSFFSGNPISLPPPPPRVSDTDGRRYHSWIEHSSQPQHRFRDQSHQPPSLPPHPPLPSCRDNDYQPRLNVRFSDNSEMRRGKLPEYSGCVDDRFRYDFNCKDDFSGDEERLWGPNDNDEKRRFLSVDDRYNKGKLLDESLLRDYTPNSWNYETYDDRSTDSKWSLRLFRDVGMDKDNGYGSARSPPKFSSGRYNTSRRFFGISRMKECKQKFIHRSPRKKPIQKKSALLRIQLGSRGDNSIINSNNHRSNGYSCYSHGYFDKSTDANATLSWQENNSYVTSDHSIEETRDASPVELDVSFKSNSLVAKAILTPSSPSGGSNRIPTLRVRKSKENLLCSPLTKPSEDLFNTNSIPDRNDPPRKKFNGCRASGSSSQIIKRAIDEMDGKGASTLSPNFKASDSYGNSGGSPPYSQRINKRKKIIAARTLECVQQSLEVLDELTKSEVDNSTEDIPTISQLEDSKHLELNDAFSDVFSKNYIVESPSSNNPLVNIEHRSFQGMILDKSETEFGFAKPYAHSCVGKTGDSAVSSILSCTLYSDSSAFSSRVETVIEEVPVQAYKSDNNYDSTISPLECRSAHSPSEKLFDFTQHASQSKLVSIENAHARGSQEVEVPDKDCTESSQPSTKELESPMHHAFRPVDVNAFSHTCDFGCVVTDCDPGCAAKDEDISHDYVGFSDAGFKEVSVNWTTLSPGTKPCEIVPDVCGSRDSTLACGENGNVLSSDLLGNSSKESNQSIAALQDDLESDFPQKIVDELVAPLQKSVGSVDSLEVYSPTSGRKRKSMDIQLVSSCSDACELPVTTCSWVCAESAGNCWLNNASCVKESINIDKNNGTSSGANLAGNRVILPDLFDDMNEVSPMYGKKSKISPGKHDTLQSDSNYSSADWRKVGLEGITRLAFANIPSPTVLAGKLIQDITSGVSSKTVANINGSSNECQETDLKDDSMPVVINLESFSPHHCFTNRASTSNSVDDVTSTSPNDQSPMYPGNLSVPDMDDFKTSVSGSSYAMVHQNDKTLNIETLSVSDSEVDKIVALRAAGSSTVGNTTTLTQPQGTGKVNHSISSVWVNSNSCGNSPITVGPRVYPSVPSGNTTASRKAGSLNHIAKPRTWHRTSNISGSIVADPVTHSIVPPESYTQKKVARVHNTYVRKGNSLVRKSSPICVTSKGVYASSSKVNGVKFCVDNLAKVKELDPRYSHTNTETSVATERHNTTDQIPKMPSSYLGTKMLSSSALNLNGDASFPELGLSENVVSVTSLNPLELTAELDDFNSKDAVKSSGAFTCQTGSVQNFGGKGVMLDKDHGQKIMYVKHRRNQLIAAMGTGGTTVPSGCKMRASSASGYYKRRKNQLVRTSLENHVEKSIAAANGSQNEEGEQMKLSGKGKCKLLNSSVWRLYDTESSKSDSNSVRSFRVWHLFPWKKATYLRHFMSTPNGSSLSILSQKLLSRSRATVYTKSTDGFSLRRSKVLSVGGSNLKWSKSSDCKLKKANEEVTLAVAADVKSRKELKMDPSGLLSRSNLVSRKRIFRIGSQRYKMDPTRKTLHRITHEKDQPQSGTQADENGKKSYVPRRLFFGNNEYVRIGNGNQLVRDPKKRTRTLASEKVRWSLHTARLRLAKKKKYCQFFTRFGHCNRDDGKCTYIHDPSKIAVCTKFLNGSCSNQNCKLTHEVIPERMPDCSFFLQGLCSNKNCPYRHVHVHPSSSVCEGFLKGYCASGNECRKKHSYVCPIFEASGACPQGSQCKLHHPKKRIQIKKALKEQKKAPRRYFVTGDIETSECTVSKMLSERCNDDILYEDGRIADYISL